METTMIPLAIRRLPHAKGLPLPSYATEGSVGLDLIAAVEDHMAIYVGATWLVPTGLCVAIPTGYELQIRPRSGIVSISQGAFNWRLSVDSVGF
jgi:dUTP pyrophosphatase